MNAVEPLDIRGFQAFGYLGPQRAMATEQSCSLEREVIAGLGLQRPFKPIHPLVRRLLRSVPGAKKGPPKYNRHFDWPLIRELALNSCILDAVESVLGQNLVLWRSNVFFQHASEYDSLPWHRDAYTSILSDEDAQVSVQIALTPTTEQNCLQIVPGSHAMSDDELRRDMGLAAKTKRDPAGNTHYVQTAPLPFPTSVILAPGEFILFHPGTVHRSSVAEGGTGQTPPRLCLTLRYTLPGNVMQGEGRVRRCALVRGESSDADESAEDWTSRASTCTS